MITKLPASNATNKPCSLVLNLHDAHMATATQCLTVEAGAGHKAQSYTQHTPTPKQIIVDVLRSSELGAISSLPTPSNAPLQGPGSKAGRTNSKQSRFSHGISHIVPPLFSLTLIISVPSLLHRKRAFRDSMGLTTRALIALSSPGNPRATLITPLLPPFALSKGRWAPV